jgi:hypothetical protein
MSDAKAKVKQAIDSGAKSAKEATDKLAKKSSATAKAVGESVKDAGDRIKKMGN